MNQLGEQPQEASSYRERLAAGIARYRAEDREELLAFRRAMHGESSPSGNGTLLRWLYEESPRARATGASDLWLYRHSSEIVAQQGAMATVLKVGTQYFDAAWAIHLLVKPAHQLRGIGAMLSERCFEEHQLSLGVEVSDEARRSFLRAGWIDLGHVPLFVRLLDARRVFSERWRHRRWTEPLGLAVNVSLAGIDAFVALRLAKRGATLVPSERFDGEVERLWNKVAHYYPVICRRDREELNWRYADYPERQRYRLYYCKVGREVVGYAVLRFDRSQPRRPVGHIVDFLCAPQWSWYLLACSVGICKQAGMAVVHCLHTNAAAGAALCQLGFVRRDSGWPLMFRARDLAPASMALLCQRDAWYLTAGDSDLDRPREATAHPRGSPWDHRPSSQEHPSAS
jgi:hypothetical protein